MRLQIFCLLFTWIISNSIGNRIHNDLIQCYRGNALEPIIPFTKQLLLELIRKIEDANPTSMDIRRLSVNIIHRLRIDGIEKSAGIQETEFNTPYAVNGIMAPKYRILLQLISDTPGAMNFTNYLTSEEMCHLHRIVSSGVEAKARGDEHKTCSLNTMNSRPPPTINRPHIINGVKYNMNTVSRCPIEKGVILTNDYGSLSPGIFIASIAAGLQPQNVQIREFISHDAYKNLEILNQLKSEKETSTSIELLQEKENHNKLIDSLDTIDNIYAASIVGDLSEICVFQGPYYGVNISVGLQGKWNDTIFPKIRYLNNNNNGHWELTNSEILAGIDGLYIGKEISVWLNKIQRIRLSQLLDMYYSSRGIPVLSIENINRKLSGNSNNNNFLDYSDTEGTPYNTNDGINQACHRRKILNSIDIEKLKSETYHFAQILQYTTPSFVISDNELRINCDATVDRFLQYSKTLLDSLPDCSHISRELRSPTVDLTLIIDGSRREYESLQLISHISEIIDVSTYSSHISVIHGGSGVYLVNRTNSVSSVFTQLKNFTGNYPTSLSLTRSLTSLLRELNNQSLIEQQSRIIGATSKVILIISQSNRIDTIDFDNAKSLLNNSLKQFPNLYFIFVTNSPDTFKQLITNNGDTNLKTEYYSIISSASLIPTDYSKQILLKLQEIPKRIMAPFCSSKINNIANKNIDQRFVRDEYEEYLTPNIENHYKISSYYFRYSNHVNIQFIGIGYGTFAVCMSRQSDYTPIECKNIDDNDVWFNFTKPCENIVDCSGIYFSVIMDSSNLRCTENDCRYPDQVRFILRQEGLRCEIDGNGTSAVNKLSFFMIIFSSLFVYIKSGLCI